MNATIYGVGTSSFGVQRERSAADLVELAVLEALAAAEVDGVGEIDAVWVGSVFGAPGVAQRSLHRLGLTDLPILTVENACASGTTAVHEARTAVELGRYERVLALGVETMSSSFGGAIHPEASDREGRQGLALPGLYALAASRYVGQGWVTLEQLAQVSVKNHRHALGNRRAQYSGDYTVEEVLDSRMIADPLTLLQCCPISDGAAAAVIGVPRAGHDDVRIIASELCSGRLWNEGSDDVWGYDLARCTAARAYESAGIGPSDIDLFEVHDAFTIGEVVTTEALGLAERGGGGELVASGRTSLGREQPVNPSGGLLSRGHPLGATGVAQVAEAVWQLQGRADGRQVEGARTALVETLGGGVSGIDGNACGVLVLGG